VPACGVNGGIVGNGVLLELADLLLWHFGLYTSAMIQINKHAMNECNDMRKDILKHDLTKLVS
jgi:hypothetical protein